MTSFQNRRPMQIMVPRIEWGDFNDWVYGFGILSPSWRYLERCSGGFFQLESHFTCSVGLLTDLWIVRGNKVLGRDVFVQLGVVLYLDVSENSGTPKSSILIGFSIINHPF